MQLFIDMAMVLMACAEKLQIAMVLLKEASALALAFQLLVSMKNHFYITYIKLILSTPITTMGCLVCYCRWLASTLL